MADIVSQSRSIELNTTVINFHGVKKLPRDSKFDAIVIDEAHRWITSYPKRSTIWHDIRYFTKNKPVIFSSGTLTPEGYSGLFNMLTLSDYMKWSKKYTTFKQWFLEYGKPYKIMINDHLIERYDRTRESKVLKDVEKYTVTITRKEAGHTHEATDRLVNVPLTKKQLGFYDKIDVYGMVEKYDIIADTPASRNIKKHQISGGMVKNEFDEYYIFKKNPKLEWLLKNIDPKDTVILAYHVAEQKMLKEHFPMTGSVTKNAEGVDYSHITRMVIYSMSFSAATYEQVRARQMNFSRDKPVEIIFLLSGIDHHVYKAVSNKKNFTSSWYKRNVNG